MIVIEEGLRNCVDMEFYREVLADFITDSSKRMEQLDTSFESESWDTYRRAVHSLKSLAGIIGATQLSTAAALHQQAAAAEDIDYITKNYAALMSEYRIVIDEAYEILQR